MAKTLPGMPVAPPPPIVRQNTPGMYSIIVKRKKK